MTNKPIYLIVKIDAEQIDGDSQDLVDQLVQPSAHTGKFDVDGFSFTVTVEQVSHGRYPS